MSVTTLLTTESHVVIGQYFSQSQPTTNTHLHDDYDVLGEPDPQGWELVYIPDVFFIIIEPASVVNYRLSYDSETKQERRNKHPR